ncbi:MAG: glycosyltransferase family 1 protein [Anaerolineae bacterium]
MNVTIDVSPTVQKHAGLGRYAGEVALALSQRDDVALSLFFNGHGNATLPGYLAHVPHKSVSVGNKPWRMAVLLSSLLRWPMDGAFGASTIFHSTNHLLGHFRRAKTVFTLHDLIFLHYPQFHLPTNRWFLTLAMPRFLRAADAIVTPSDCSRQDAIKFYNLPPEKITVIYEAAAPHFQPTPNPADLARVKAAYQLPDDFILHVGTIEPRKNLGRLLEAFQTLLADFPNLHLVLIGKRGWLVDDFFSRLQELGLAERVIFPGYIAGEDLPAVYQLARLLAYPSLYEGFGLPPLEAMACGTPVVCSNAASLPEVVGDAGLLVQPTDTAALAQAMGRLLADNSLHADLSRRALALAAQFSWGSAGEQLATLYAGLLKQ